jgi:hypothetical protein
LAGIWSGRKLRIHTGERLPYILTAFLLSELLLTFHRHLLSLLSHQGLLVSYIRRVVDPFGGPGRKS